MRARIEYYTKRQVELFLTSWDCADAQIPGKSGGSLLIGFPTSASDALAVDLVEIKWTNRTSDSKERLWAVTMSSPAGRQFDESVQEAHVLAHLQNAFEGSRKARMDELCVLATRL